MAHIFGLLKYMFAVLLILSDSVCSQRNRYEKDAVKQHMQELLDLIHARNSMSRNRRVPLSNLDLGIGSRLWSVANIGNRLFERSQLHDPESPGKRRRRGVLTRELDNLRNEYEV